MSASPAVESLRPRFLPDRDAPREWGDKGSKVARLIRKGFAVPPSAAMGLTQVTAWLESLPQYEPAIQAWQTDAPDRTSKLSELEQAILGAPMPEHWPLSAGTLRQFLCGDPAELNSASEAAETWPLILRPSLSGAGVSPKGLVGCCKSVVVRETTPENLWHGFVQVVASAFRPSTAQGLTASGIVPRSFRVGVLIQPQLIAELSGVCLCDGQLEWGRGSGERARRHQGEGPVPELAPFWAKLWQRARKAKKILGPSVGLEWLWDGAQLWFIQARLTLESEQGGTRRRENFWAKWLRIG